MSDQWKLILGDCLDPVTGLASLADGSVDHVITDPPYASEIYHRPRPTNHQHTAGGTSPSLEMLASGAIGSLDAALVPFISQAARLVLRWVIVFVDAETVGAVRSVMLSTSLRYVRTGAWVKTNPMPQFTGDRPAHGFEACAIAHQALPRKMRWNGGGKPGVWICGIENGASADRPDHPCPKPVPLMAALIRDFTDPGDLILDPFAGSGTTGVAAIRLGRRFIGWERDPKYHAIAVKRLTAAREQLEFAS